MELIRHITIAPVLNDGNAFALKLYDTHKRDNRGQTILAYEFQLGGEPLFAGSDFAGSPLHADDSDATVCALLAFLTLRPGDTDSEYFESYTEAQMDWAQSYECETLQCDLVCLEERGEDTEDYFTDV